MISGMQLHGYGTISSLILTIGLGIYVGRKFKSGFLTALLCSALGAVPSTVTKLTDFNPIYDYVSSDARALGSKEIDAVENFLLLTPILLLIFIIARAIARVAVKHKVR